MNLSGAPLRMTIFWGFEESILNKIALKAERDILPLID
jgi:hypothetical protein